MTVQMRNYGMETQAERLRIENSHFTAEQVEKRARTMEEAFFETAKPAWGAKSFEVARNCSIYAFVQHFAQGAPPEFSVTLEPHLQRIVPLIWMHACFLNFAPYVVALAVLKESLRRAGAGEHARGCCECEKEFIKVIAAWFNSKKDYWEHDKFLEMTSKMKYCEEMLCEIVDLYLGPSAGSLDLGASQ
jgi:hypothetical protein